MVTASAWRRRLARAADVGVVLCLAFLILILIGWALGLVHITGIHHPTTITPRINPSQAA